MKSLKYIIIFLLAQLVWSCKKDSSIPSVPVSSITVVNALPNSSPLIVDFYNTKNVSTYYSSAPQISFSAFQEFGIQSGSIPVTIYQTSDTTHSVYKKSVDSQANGIYSLFICGTISQPDNLLTTDHPPYHAAADSTVGVRFINLSPGSNAVSVDIQGKSNGSEVQSLAYKSITNFKSYPATSNISSYTFEFRDSSSGTLLSTFTISGINNGDNGEQSTNQYRWKNITIALNGLPGSQGAFQINNY